jgi:diketogulonate reductase-like aldo/keto reductase
MAEKTGETTRTFGPTGQAVATLGEGTWQMEHDDRKSAIASIRRAIDLGLTHIDTAELYGDGKVESLVAEALAGVRDRTFLASKVMPSNATRTGTIQACERSLKRLGTDYLDLYLLHWPGTHPLAETISAFEELAKSGKIRFWGVSNFDEDEIDRAVALAGPGRVACNQVLYHLNERRIEHRVIPQCMRHGIAVVGYSPFGSGEFPPLGSRSGACLADVARELGATPYQVALAFLVRDPNVFSIPKASQPAHVQENAGASSIALSADHLRRLDEAFPLGSRRPGVPML